MRKIFFSKSIVKKEDLNSEERGWILKAFQKGIFQIIKGEFLPQNSKLAKLYMTTVIGPRRAVFLVNVKTGDAFFLMFRTKKDPIGANISIKNAFFKTTLKKYLAILSEDIVKGAVEVIDI